VNRIFITRGARSYELVYKVVIPSVTIGRSRRIPINALQAFVDRLLADNQ
jgi:hypothetical protein